MVVAFEEKTPMVQDKIDKLKTIFNKQFTTIIFTVHPYGKQHEIPGKCSNINYALRQLVQEMKNRLRNDFDPSKIIVTTCDVDTIFPSKYIEAVNREFLMTDEPTSVIFQAPLFYNWKLDSACFFTRVTGLLRSTLMMGALIPFSINSMSNFSYALQLCMNADYVHPGYQMEDIICLIRWMGQTGKQIRIKLIPLPVLSGPTSGANIVLELLEWIRQIKRWSIGAWEVFHYYVVKSYNMPGLGAVKWGLSFVCYYVLLLCCERLFFLSTVLYVILNISNTPTMIFYTTIAMLVCQQLIFIVIFLYIDIKAKKLMKIQENIGLLVNLIHWLSTPFVLVFYSMIKFYSLHELMIRGKKVCNHIPAEKSNLDVLVTSATQSNKNINFQHA